ncbi:hypothetical protein JCM8097_003877 [Rhodosporidiobolus ruineniae]
MTDYERTLEQVPLIMLTDGKKSYLLTTPEMPSGAPVTHAMQQVKADAARLFPDLDKDSLRLAVQLPGRGFVGVTYGACYATLRLLAHDSDLPPVLHVKDKNTPDEPVLPSHCPSSVGETEDLFSCPASSGTVVDSASDERPILVHVKTLTGKTMRIPVLPAATADHLKSLIQAMEGIPPYQQRLVFAGRPLEDNELLVECRIVDGSVLHVITRLRGDKPVIYLFPPVPLPSVQVGLTLSPQWSFSALYPVVDVSKNRNGESSVYWQVSAEPSGTLVDLKTQTSLSYLFWEAHSEPKPFSLEQNVGTKPAFDPSQPVLNASNGIALPFSSFLPYLDKTLAALSLHTAARNDFITYWLSAFNRIHARSQLVAFRFLPQAQYEQAAKLEVDPKPDVVTRVFMLFKGVDEAETEGWRKPDEVDWVSEVGVKVDEARDEGLFRVLEWGGMEIVG